MRQMIVHQPETEPFRAKGVQEMITKCFCALETVIA